MSGCVIHISNIVITSGKERDTLINTSLTLTTLPKSHNHFNFQHTGLRTILTQSKERNDGMISYPNRWKNQSWSMYLNLYHPKTTTNNKNKTTVIIPGCTTNLGHDVVLHLPRMQVEIIIYQYCVDGVELITMSSSFSYRDFVIFILQPVPCGRAFYHSSLK